MDEAWDHGLELVAPLVALSKTGEATLGVIGAELAIGSGDGALDVAERGIDPLERRHTGRLASRAGAGLPDGRKRSCPTLKGRPTLLIAYGRPFNSTRDHLSHKHWITQRG